METRSSSDTVPRNGPARRPWISFGLDRGRAIVPVRDGGADFTRGLVLNRTAVQILNCYGTKGDWGEVAAELARDQRIALDRAQSDVDGLRRDLEDREVSPELLGELDFSVDPAPVPATDSPLTPEPTSCSPASAFSGEDFEFLAREALRSGLSIRFLARGHSMRPGIPDGSILVVVPASFDSLESGQIILYGAGVHRLVAHRILDRRGDRVRTRGDSSPRIDEVGGDGFLGLVAERVLVREGREEHRVDLLSRASIGRGCRARFFHRIKIGCARVLSWPLRRSYPGRSLFRDSLVFGLRVVSRLLTRFERRASKLRLPVSVWTAALMSTEDKDRRRRALYGTWGVQEFTALEENVRAGLTLIEEVALRRHGIDGGSTLVLGCGPGREAIALAESGFSVVGIDWEESMLERARREAAARGLAIEFMRQEADGFDFGERRFDSVLVFSGLYNMLLPRDRRVALLERARKHLAPGGRVVLTFLSSYVDPGNEDSLPLPSRLRALNPEHEPGDLFLINEAVHIFPRGRDLEGESRDAGLEVEVLWRDQRAYDKVHDQVKGYAILKRPGG